MTPRPLWRPLAFVLAALGATAVHAQDDPAQASFLAVEAVIFQHVGSGADTHWAPRPEPPTAPAARVLGEGQGLVPYRGLSRNELQLAGVRQRLASASGYEVLSHVGWVQPAVPESETASVLLPTQWRPRDLEEPFATGPDGARLFGSMRVYSSRFRHVQVDLRFAPDGHSPAPRRMSPTEPAEPDPGTDLLEPEALPEPASVPAPAVYPMIQSRRLDGTKLHYLDHPVIGVILQVRELGGG